MATTFDVYPQSAFIPSFHQLLALASTRLHETLLALGINTKLTIEINLHTSKPDTARKVDLSTPALWETYEYAWFCFPHVAGGTDAYFRHWHYEQKKALMEETAENQRMRQMKAKMAACLSNDHYWCFRRSAGQPALINLAYGLIAAALAEITEGLIYSEDNAWEYERFPASASEFYSWYFRPEKAIDPKIREWAVRNIKELAKEVTT